MRIAGMFVGGGIARGRWLAMVAGLMAAMSLPMEAAAQSQDPVDCDSISIELADQFTSPICYLQRFRSGGAIGRNHAIHGESRDYMIHFQSSRSGAGHTYLNAIDFEMLMGFYGVTADQADPGATREVPRGFRYISVGGAGLDSCILFLKQDRPIRSGFRAQYYGLACDKGRTGDYAPEDAAALIDMIKDY